MSPAIYKSNGGGYEEEVCDSGDGTSGPGSSCCWSHVPARFEDDGLWPVRKAIKSLDLGYEASDSQVWAADHVESTDPRFIYGAIIGVADLVSVHRSRSRGEYGISCFSDELNSWGSVCSEYAEDVSWHLMFTNSRRLETPIPYKGALGIRCLPDEVEARVLAGLQPVTHTGM